MRIVVVWEDEKHGHLDTLVRRRITALAPPDRTRPDVLFHSTRGNGRFRAYVDQTWPLLRAKGLSDRSGKVDHLICVPDGDRVHEQLPTIAKPPQSPADVHAWHVATTAAWQHHLRGLCTAVPAETVHGVVLRWCKESLVLAGHDLEPIAARLGLDLSSGGARDFLAACTPAPSAIASLEFANTYPRPLRCLAQLASACGKQVTKNDIRVEDALKALAAEHHATLAARVPDIDAIARLAWSLTTP